MSRPARQPRTREGFLTQAYAEYTNLVSCLDELSARSARATPRLTAADRAELINKAVAYSAESLGALVCYAQLVEERLRDTRGTRYGRPWFTKGRV